MSTSTALAPVLPGEVLAGKYRVERVLGQGGMGVVVAARHLELDERVAIKFLVGEPPPAAVERFAREARAAAKVKSEHVCRVFDVGKLETGEPYLVMEHLEGEDLGEKIDREGPQTLVDSAGWVIEACDALAEAHALGIVHRDLKPPNVFLAKRADGSRCAKVLDFGISKLPSIGSMTKSAVMMGSPFYMSPEQIESSRDVDARADIWSLGVMLYELLAGSPPFCADSMVQLAVMVRETAYEPVTRRVPSLPSKIDEILARCLAKSPADRYPGVAGLVADLAQFASPDIAPLAMRLARRSTPNIGAVAYASTARETPSVRDLAAAASSSVSSSRDGVTTRVETGRGSTPTAPTEEDGKDRADLERTFEPVQSVSQERAKPPARRAARLVGLIALGGVAVAAAFALTRPARPVGIVAAPTATTSVASANPGAVSATVGAAAQPPSPSVGEPPAVALVPPIAPGAPVVLPRTTGGPRPSSARLSAPPASAAPPASPSTPSAATPAAEPTPKKKKRELDREF
jgi:serine/threonine-protein kinase